MALANAFLYWEAARARSSNLRMSPSCGLSPANMGHTFSQVFSLLEPKNTGLLWGPTNRTDGDIPRNFEGPGTA